MNYEIKVLDEKVIRLLLYLEEMHLIQFRKKTPSNIKEPKIKSFGGRISKEDASDLHRQLKEMRDEWERI